ncbi:hypothetical protein RF11_12305 [Thelohanellus kitauei]|uniref:Integrase catalytic domain-containing protein n=1 Tax=Thelohanellus kitauei TaxID=669202 RepID=A0A0C2NFZ9_THEKT|nr:hypothetical protein RF11_12305 [Thelohanellus kitauei]
MDTGASVSCLEPAVWDSLSKPSLMPGCIIKGYGNNPIITLGTIIVEVKTKLERILETYEEVFSNDTLGTKGYTKSIKLRSACSPQVFQPRNVRYAVRNQVEQELEQLSTEGIIQKIDDPNEQLRICRDFKVSINKHKNYLPYPLPTFRDILEKIKCGQRFICHPFGISSAPSIFQNFMDTLLHEINNELTLTTSIEKCKFYQSEVKFLGHIINKEGVRPIDERITPLLNLPAPTNTLRHFNEKLPIIMSTDASAVGIEGVLAHRLEDGTERHVTYVSRQLSKAEINYSVTDREALSIIYAVKKFHEYIYGREFILVTDHKPLTRIFGPCLKKSSTVSYRQNNHNTVADVLSRLPYQSPEEKSDGSLIRLMLADETSKDNLLSKIRKYLSLGWPDRSNLNREEIQMFERRTALSFEEGILLYHDRVVIPKTLIYKTLEYLHTNHPGISVMKQIARYYARCPSINNDIELYTSIYPWPTATLSWDRVHIDYAKIDESDWFLVVDAFSKWVALFSMKSWSSNETIKYIEELFSRWGVPKKIVSDNGQQLDSKECEEFCHEYGLKRM